MTRRFIDLVGQRFGRLCVLRRAETKRGHGKQAKWCARCDCGQEVVVDGHGLRSNRTRSCGCLRSERRHTFNVKHGHTRNGVPSPEYRTWLAIIARCTNPRNKDFARYGGRGIKIEKAWRDDFMAFFKHIGLKPSPEHQIDRIDNDSGYVLGNVRWVMPKEQQRNRGNVRRITFRGETLCLSEWAERLGISKSALAYRLQRWPLNRALTEVGRAYPR